jgi:hypothetical protein
VLIHWWSNRRSARRCPQYDEFGQGGLSAPANTGSAVGHGVERIADLSSPTAAELPEPRREHRLGDRREVVERSDAVVVDALIGPDANAGWDVSQRARQRCNDDVVEHWDNWLFSLNWGASVG